MQRSDSVAYIMSSATKRAAGQPVLSVCSDFFSQLKYTMVWWIRDSEFPAGVIVNLSGCGVSIVNLISISSLEMMDGWKLPNSLVREPSSVTLVVSIIISSLELCWGGDGGAVLDTGRLSLLKRQGVAGGDGSVVEHNTCKMQKVSRRQEPCDQISLKSSC